ncbi:MAG: hypothetical protein IJU23_10530 [Proteobacteria bacterium]|nr:hypothetical protein [Pseudomonadota bacterium]
MKHSSAVILGLILPLAFQACHKPPQDKAAQEPQAQEAQLTAPTQDEPDAAKPAESADAVAETPAESPAEPEAQADKGFVKTSGDWSDIQLEIRNFPDSSDDADKAQIQKDLAELLKNWNSLRNLKDSDKLSKLYAGRAYLRGSALEQKAIAPKLKKSFEKHKDFSQTPAIHVVIDYLYTSADESVEHWSARFNETFFQDGKTTDTEILIVFKRELPDDAQAFWSIVVESDISTDRNMLKKLGLLPPNAPNDCEGLAYQILIDSPMLRYEINTMYEAALEAEKSGELDGLVISDDPSEEEPSDTAKSFFYRLYEDHAGDPENPDDSGHRATLNMYTVEFEENKIVDEVYEISHIIDPQYKADIKRLCKL